MQIGVAITGLGGFAGSHHAAVQALEAEGICRLICTCDPDLDARQPQIERFGLRDRQVSLYRDFSTMLQAEASRIDVVLLPTPIPIHAQQLAAVIALGKGCYLEKPPTLWWPEYLQMLSAEKNAKVATQIGFNFVGDPFRQELKARMDAGEFGEIEGATLLAVWPRHEDYFLRNDWAGRMSVRGQPVQDSCIGNALAHFVQNLLLWCDSIDPSAIESVRALLFKAHAIESFDTTFIEVRLQDGRWLRIGATHTGQGPVSDCEVVHCSKAKIVFDTWRTARIEFKDGVVEHIQSDFADAGALLRENIRKYLSYVNGNSPRPVTTLEDCRSFVALHNLAFLSSEQIETLDPNRIDRNAAPGFLPVSGLEGELKAFVHEGKWPQFEREVLPVGVGRLEELLG